MQKTFYILLFSLVFFAMKAQTNLVPNGSFEQYSQCPFNGGQINFINNWFDPTNASSDFLSTCATNSCLTLPNNCAGYQQPFQGNNCVGIVPIGYPTGNHTASEYISAQLTQSLVANENYILSYYIVMADSSEYAVKNIGCYFSVNDISGFTNFESLPYEPQIYNNVFITDTSNWVKVTGNYTATGGELFLTLGYFRDTTEVIDTMFIANHHVSLPDQSYYYIDSVSLFNSNEISLKTYSQNEQMILRKDFYLKLNTDLFVDFSCLKLSDSAIINIYNMSSELVWTDRNVRKWAGNNQNNLIADEGFYFYTINDNNNYITGKIILTKH